MSARTLRIACLILVLAAAGCGSPEPKPAAPGKGADNGPTSKTAPRGSAEERGDTTLYGLDVVDAQTAFAWGTNDQGYVGSLVLKTSDGGAHWTCVLRTDQTELVGIDLLDAQNGTAISNGGVVYTTSDGGATWKASNDLGLLTQRFSLAPQETAARAQQSYSELDGITFSGEKNGWAFGNRVENAPGTKPGRINQVTRPVVLRTTDGASWKELKLGADAPAVGLTRGFFTDAQKGCVVGGDIDEDVTGPVLRTTDGGTTWKAVTQDAKQVPEDVFFVDAAHGWVVGATEDENGEPGPSEVFATTDGGQTWRLLAKVPASLRSVRFADAQNGWAVGAGGKIFGTTDGGATWADQTAQDWSAGQMLDLTDPQYPQGGPAPTFTGFVLVAPGHGWASADLGVYEYKAK